MDGICLLGLFESDDSSNSFTILQINDQTAISQLNVLMLRSATRFTLVSNTFSSLFFFALTQKKMLTVKHSGEDKFFPNPLPNIFLFFSMP